MTPLPDDQRAELEALLTECIDLVDAGRSEALEALLAAHPNEAPELRELLASLANLGMVGDPDDPNAQEQLGEYRLLRRLGAGGMGTVYLARQESLRRLVALKVVHPSLALSPKARERFRREAQAIARLSHPSIVRVFGAGEENSRLYYAMEYVAGRDLRARMAEGSCAELADLLRWTRDIAWALQTAHEAGIVHRDVKPSNLLIAEDGTARLLDFGLARDEEAESLSVSGVFQGSPHYAAPEQVEGRRGSIGPHTDVYGLGVTLYEILVGMRPFDGDSTQSVFHAILHAEPVPLRERAPDLPRNLEVVVSKAMERDPARRYRSARELAEDLEALLEYRPIRARPIGSLRRYAKWARRNRLSAALLGGLLLLAVGAPASLFVQRELAARESARRERDLLAERERAAREQERIALEAQSERKGRAGELLDLVMTELDNLAADRARALGQVEVVAALERGLSEEQGDPTAWATLDARQAQLRRSLGERRGTLAELGAHLSEAAQLVDDPPGLPRAQARLHLEHLFLARALGEEMAADYFLEQVRRADAEGALRNQTEGVTAVRIHVDPEGTSVHLFRYLDGRSLGEGVGARLVAVPLRGPLEDIPPGTWALRPLEPHPQLEATDCILAVGGRPVGGPALGARPRDVFALADRNGVRRGQRWVRLDETPVTSARAEERLNPDLAQTHSFTFEGGDPGDTTVVEASALRAIDLPVGDARQLVTGGQVEVEVYRHGERLTLRLESGVDTRLTASPLLLGPRSALGPSPVPEQRLPEGAYVAVFVTEDRRPVRVPFDVVAGAPIELDLSLPRESPPDPAFVPVLRSHTGAKVPFWILDHEVTLGEYLEFLNDPETLEATEGGTTIYAPREFDAQGSYIQRTPDGHWIVPWHYTWDTPAMGLSYLDARAYCDWLDRRAEERGEPWVHSVPSQEEIDAVRLVSRHRTWVNGDDFRPHFVHSRLAGSEMALEPVLRYPIDEYPHGVFDLSGGLYEWSRSWFDEPNRIRRISGGSWHQSAAGQFQSSMWHSSSEHTPSGSYGFRIVARPGP